MHSLTVLNTMWRHKKVAIPVVVLTLVACVFVFFFAPRTYQASVSYVLSAPKLASNVETQRGETPRNVNDDNPYLRTTESSLLPHAVITRLSDPRYSQELEAAGLSTDYTIAPVSDFDIGLMTVTATASSGPLAVETVEFAGKQFSDTVRELQQVNGADKRYLYQPIAVRGPGPAQEVFPNRLRSLILTFVAGGIVLFGAVSVAQSMATRKNHERRTMEESNENAMTGVL